MDDAWTMLEAPGEVPHLQPPGAVLPVASPCAEGLSVAGAGLRVGSGAPRLVFSLLVLGLSLAPALVVLVPVVPRDTRGSAPTGKYVAGFDDGGRGHGPRNQAAF